MEGFQSQHCRMPVANEGLAWPKQKWEILVCDDGVLGEGYIQVIFYNLEVSANGLRAWWFEWFGYHGISWDDWDLVLRGTPKIPNHQFTVSFSDFRHHLRVIKQKVEFIWLGNQPFQMYSQITIHQMFPVLGSKNHPQKTFETTTAQYFLTICPPPNMKLNVTFLQCCPLYLNRLWQPQPA